MLRFRQIHLDFHTPGSIQVVGQQFEKSRFQNTLRMASVNSVTAFATCHHGWSYYDTSVGTRHPGLSFDLLRAQYEACKEVDINVPIYLSAGVHDLAAELHPEWRLLDADGRLSGWADSNLKAGFKMLSFHSPYLDYLCDQVQEVVMLFPGCNGIFLDIINQGEDCSIWGLRYMQEAGLDPLRPEDRLQCRVDALEKYYERVTSAVRSISPEMPIFHNSSHVTPGLRRVLQYFSHLELESLPTGGWGYDHFPISAKYVKQLDIDSLGMTGKFHTTWGEFGGFKHPNALRYECCAMIAFGTKCSVGDQLHPSGRLDESTYSLIGEAYREVAQKEAFVIGAQSIADIALLSSMSVKAEESFSQNTRENAADTGATRVLLEEHLLFDVIDPEMDFSRFRMLVLPDDVQVGPHLEAKLRQYLKKGGKLFLTGKSGVDSERGMLFDVGGVVGLESDFCPDYIVPRQDLAPDFVASPMVMYFKSLRLKTTDGCQLGVVHDPYFNRSWDHFYGHQHAPPRLETSGFVSGSCKNSILYLAHPVFTIYGAYGQVALRQHIGKAIRMMLGSDNRLKVVGLPSTARVTLTWQPKEERYVLHLLNACPVKRGGGGHPSYSSTDNEQMSYEIIEDIVPVHNVSIALTVEQTIRQVFLEPDGKDISFEQHDTQVRLTLPVLRHHQMITFHV